MAEEIVKAITNLLKVKSIVTIFMTAIFGIITLRGLISGEQFLSVFLVIVSFYFGVQSQKVVDFLEQKVATRNVDTSK